MSKYPVTCATAVLVFGLFAVYALSAAAMKGPWTETYRLWTGQRIVVTNGCRHSEKIDVHVLTDDGDVELICVKP